MRGNGNQSEKLATAVSPVAVEGIKEKAADRIEESPPTAEGSIGLGYDPTDGDDGEPGRPIATILHLTDLHLFLGPPVAGDESGGDRYAAADPVTASLRMAIFDLLPGLESFPHPDMRAQQQLISTLPKAVRDEFDRARRLQGPPLIVLQTGDVEAYGAMHNPKYLGHEFLRSEVRSQLQSHEMCSWFDVYGNHDVLPASFPIPERCVPSLSERIRESPPMGNEYKHDWPRIDSVEDRRNPEINIEVHRFEQCA